MILNHKQSSFSRPTRSRPTSLSLLSQMAGHPCEPVTSPTSALTSPSRRSRGQPWPGSTVSTVLFCSFILDTSPCVEYAKAVVTTLAHGVQDKEAFNPGLFPSMLKIIPRVMCLRESGSNSDDKKNNSQHLLSVPGTDCLLNSFSPPHSPERQEFLSPPFVRDSGISLGTHN